MKIRQWAFLFAALTGLSTADDFDLPEDVNQAEIIRIVPIEANYTTEKKAEAKAEAKEDSVRIPSEPFSLVAAPVPGSNLHDSSAGLKREAIPQDLNRNLRVGIFTGVKELYLKYAGDVIKITPSGKNIKLQAGSQSMEMENREFANEDGSCIAVAADSKSLQRACYPGSVLFRSTNGKLDAINSVDVEDYLRGVVPYEIGRLDSSRVEALKAQAVAARTYAYKHFNSREAIGFDVYADTKDQVYKGLEGATPLTDDAIKATAGVVMTYNGEFIIAYYHSTCGGETETLATWNRPDLPYLQSRPDKRPDGSAWCNESSYMKWERRFTEKEMPDLFKKNLNESKAKLSDPKTGDFKKIKSIAIKDTLPSGRILTLQVKTDKGSFEVLTDRTRWLFKKGGNILPSSFFKVKKEGNEWVVTGTGFGHGVGMCQMGVRARALAGQSYQEILTHYYPGITLEKYER